MKKHVVFALALTFALLLLLTAPNVRLANSATKLQTIRIQSDGSIDPANVPIQRSGNVYTFTSDVHGTIVVARENIVIEGAGYALQGEYNGTRTDTWEVGQGSDQQTSNATLWTIGIDFEVASRPNNLTVRNLNIRYFYIGIYMWTSNNTLTGSSVTDNIVGILLSGDYNSITGNYVARNEQGVFFGVNTPGNEPLNIVLARNSFVDNDVHFSGCFCEDYNTEELVHTWDDGEKGNFWSDYYGADSDGNGIGDTPYVIDILNKDRYPLMQILAVPPVPTPDPQKPAVLIVLATASIIAFAVAIAYAKNKRVR